MKCLSLPSHWSTTCHSIRFSPPSLLFFTWHSFMLSVLQPSVFFYGSLKCRIAIIYLDETNPSGCDSKGYEPQYWWVWEDPWCKVCYSQHPMLTWSRGEPVLKIVLSGHRAQVIQNETCLGNPIQSWSTSRPRTILWYGRIPLGITCRFPSCIHASLSLIHILLTAWWIQHLSIAKWLMWCCFCLQSDFTGDKVWCLLLLCFRTLCFAGVYYFFCAK
jgi:hypothetical protein